MLLPVLATSLPSAGVTIGAPMQTGVIYADILAYNAATLLSLVLIFAVVYSNSKNLPDILSIDALACVHAIGA